MADVNLECGISKGTLNGNPLFVLTTVQTSACSFSDAKNRYGKELQWVLTGQL